VCDNQAEAHLHKRCTSQICRFMYIADLCDGSADSVLEFG